MAVRVILGKCYAFSVTCPVNLYFAYKNVVENFI